ncbi:MAG TPA: ribose-5-phosphate isomerase RpiA [Methanoregulaceae archaeon]|nr:ribose-5-phosphate isomerase RpiA [Methanoregulaceae archaeon]HQJ88127.1 ribose-5-phosphate isomerase RpiA [Methanoregulaceae archaeon]
MSDEAPKRFAGYAAADLVDSGMVVGLGTGSTVRYAMERLAERMRQGLTCVGVPTSHQTAMRARALGIPLASLNDAPRLGIAIDGADQVDPALRLIKGRGAALTREKCVAAAADRLVIVVDEGKLAERLAVQVPIEVLPFACATVTARLARMGGSGRVREGTAKDGPVVTDNGGLVIDWSFGPIDDPERLESEIERIPGVVTAGIFSGFGKKTTVIVGDDAGYRVLTR